MRNFETGATRDTDNGKFDYEGFLSPLVLERFAAYMHKNRKQADGNLRDGDNWQKGIPKDVYMKSKFRHFMDIWKEHRSIKTASGLEEALCADLFNTMGYLLEVLKEKEDQKEEELVQEAVSALRAAQRAEMEKPCSSFNLNEMVKAEHDAQQPTTDEITARMLELAAPVKPGGYYKKLEHANVEVPRQVFEAPRPVFPISALDAEEYQVVPLEAVGTQRTLLVGCNAADPFATGRVNALATKMHREVTGIVMDSALFCKKHNQYLRDVNGYKQSTAAPKRDILVGGGALPALPGEPSTSEN